MPQPKAGAIFVANSLGVGYGHACARLTNGTMYCWGAAINAQPTLPSPPDLLFSNHTGGIHFHCGILANDSTVRCWGPWVANTFSSTIVNTLKLQSNLQWQMISIASDLFCGILLDSTMKCFGNLGAISLPTASTQIRQLSTGLGPHLCYIQLSNNQAACSGWESGSNLVVPSQQMYNFQTMHGYSWGTLLDGTLIQWGSWVSYVLPRHCGQS
jgi:hypothetical protein